MELLSKIDLISPPITLYYKGKPLHPSIFSGILTIISYILMAALALYYLILYLQKENSTAFFYNRYVEYAGNFPINSSSMFNFLQIYDTLEGDSAKEIDYDLVRFIGIEKTIDTYTSNTELTNYDHWIYGKCNNDSDTKGISHLINFKDYYNSACIRKYYNKTVGKYYETNDINFRWPILINGSSNQQNSFYGIILEKCKNDSLRVNLENKYCKSDSEINEYMTHTSIKLQLLDHYADVLNYKDPFTKYFYTVTNGLFSESYTTNHLNFNPAIIKTHSGIIKERTDQKYAYFFDQNEKLTASSGNTGIYIAFYFWMQNTMQYYERKYELLQDALSSIGGITRLILSVANIINYIYSRYIILIDSEELFINQNENNFKETINNKNVVEKQIKKDVGNPNPPRRGRFYNNYQYQNNNILSNSNCMSKENVNYAKLSKENIEVYSKRDKLEKNEKKNQNKYLVYNKNNYLIGNNYFYYERKQPNQIREIKQANPLFSEKNYNLKNDINNNDKYIQEENNINDIGEKCNKSEINFCKFLSYIICCGKNNKKMRYVEELRYKILSEETIAQNYFNLKEMNKLSEFLK